MSAHCTTDADWLAVLESLQAHVETAEQLLHHGTAQLIPAWVPPLGARALPEDQVGRASALLARLGVLISEVERAAGAVHHEMDFVRSASASMSAKRSTFIDAQL